MVVITRSIFPKLYDRPWIPAITALVSTKSPRTFEPSQSSKPPMYSGFLPSLAVHAYQMDLHIAVVSHTGRTNSAAVGRSHGPDPLVDHEPTTLRLFRRLLTCQHPASTAEMWCTWVRKLMLHSFIRTEKTRQLSSFQSLLAMDSMLEQKSSCGRNTFHGLFNDDSFRVEPPKRREVGTRAYLWKCGASKVTHFRGL